MEKALPERPQERKTLAGALPEGLRTALGLSAGQPVGQLQSAMEKGQMDTGLLAATPATVVVATANVPGANSSLLSTQKYGFGMLHLKYLSMHTLLLLVLS